MARYEWALIELIVLALLVWELRNVRRASLRAGDKKRPPDA